MRYRKLSEEKVVDGVFVRSGDMQFGRSFKDFYIDQPEAVAQAVVTRLRLGLGEWFLDHAKGTPWRTKVHGKPTEATRDPVIRFRILGTQGVKEINQYFSDLNRDTRGFNVQAEITTVYGPVPLVVSSAGAVVPQIVGEVVADWDDPTSQASGVLI